MAEPTRSMVIWIPDWPVVAVRRERIDTGSEDAADLGAAPLAVIEKNVVVACSGAARAEGVRRGMRRRDAQAHCPSLETVASDAARDHRIYAPLVAAIELRAPHVQVIRPGLAALKARGPARYYGGEIEAAQTLRSALVQEGVDDARIGVGDGPFTAEQAARSTRPGEPIRVVAPGQAAEFLAPLPASAVADGDDDGADLVHLLARLGVHTLGAFAALEADRVQERLGERGVRLHALAGGGDSRPIEARTPPPELHREVVFDPPVELAEQAAFGMRVAAEAFIARLGAERLVCTELRIELQGDRGEHSERVWLHPGTFDAPAVVDRVRWQLAEDQGLRSGVTRVRISPESVDSAAHHVVGLFGAGEHEKVHHALSRVQAMLGHRAVLTPLVSGGRWLGERQVLVPWGDRPPRQREPSLPWPGSLPPPLPATVYPSPRPAEVHDANGRRVSVGERGELSAPPVEVTVEASRRGVALWAGPWPVREREWDAARRRLAHRFQVVDAAQDAWLLVYEGEHWRAEARYD